MLTAVGENCESQPQMPDKVFIVTEHGYAGGNRHSAIMLVTDDRDVAVTRIQARAASLSADLSGPLEICGQVEYHCRVTIAGVEIPASFVIAEHELVRG